MTAGDPQVTAALEGLDREAATFPRRAGTAAVLWVGALLLALAGAAGSSVLFAGAAVCAVVSAVVTPWPNRSVAGAIDRIDGVDAAGPLLASWERTSSETQRAVSHALARVLPLMDQPTANRLEPRHLDALRRLLLQADPDRDAEMVAAALHVAALVGGEPFRTDAERLACGQTASAGELLSRQAARRAINDIIRREGSRRQAATLVRPSCQPDPASTLVRPATPGTRTSVDRLVRASDVSERPDQPDPSH